MTDRELADLLGGAAGGKLTLSTPDGPVSVYFTHHELASPVAWRSALRRQLGHTGYRPPDIRPGGPRSDRAGDVQVGRRQRGGYATARSRPEVRLPANARVSRSASPCRGR